VAAAVGSGADPEGDVRMRICRTCEQKFILRDPLDNAYDVRIHLKLNPTHRVELYKLQGVI
jgi:hypothetical protein